MYIWVVLAAFVVSIYSYNLHFREDIKQVRHSPMAEAVISKVILQHKAIKSYYKNNTASVQTISDPIKEYQESDIQGFLNHGVVLDPTSKTSLFCISASDARKNTLVPCSNAASVEGYYITYMPIPRKWLNFMDAENNTASVKQEMQYAIKSVMGGSSMFGYNIPKDTNLTDPTQGYVSDEELKNYSQRSFIPEAIYKNADFNDTCMQGIPCIVYISLEFSK